MNSPLVYVAPHEGKSLRIGPYDFSFKAGRGDGSPHALAEVTVPPGAVNALHRHPQAETMYVLAGEIEFFGERGLRYRAVPGAAIHVPADAAHGFVNVGEVEARLLLVAPVAQEALFDDLAEASAGPCPDPARVAAVCARHELRPISTERSQP